MYHLMDQNVEDFQRIDPLARMNEDDGLVSLLRPAVPTLADGFHPSVAALRKPVRQDHFRSFRRIVENIRSEKIISRSQIALLSVIVLHDKERFADSA